MTSKEALKLLFTPLGIFWKPWTHSPCKKSRYLEITCWRDSLVISCSWAQPSSHPWTGTRYVNEVILDPPNQPHHQLIMSEQPQLISSGAEELPSWALPPFLTYKIKLWWNAFCIKLLVFGVICFAAIDTWNTSWRKGLTISILTSWFKVWYTKVLIMSLLNC